MVWPAVISGAAMAAPSSLRITRPARWVRRVDKALPLEGEEVEEEGAQGDLLRRRIDVVDAAKAAHEVLERKRLSVVVDGHHRALQDEARHGQAAGEGHELREASGHIAQAAAEDADGVPVAVFGCGPREDTPQAWQRSQAQLERALAKVKGFAPVRVGLFGGVDPPGRSPRRDVRDWAAIRGWALALPEVLLASPE